MNGKMKSGIMLFRNGIKKVEQLTDEALIDIKETDLFLMRRLRDGDVTLVNKIEAPVAAKTEVVDTITSKTEVAV